MKLVKLDRKLPPNHLTFIVDMRYYNIAKKQALLSFPLTLLSSHRMSQYDVRNYLRAIYGMTAKDVRLRECLGKEKTNPLYGSKLRLDDYKVAHVVMVGGGVINSCTDLTFWPCTPSKEGSFVANTRFFPLFFIVSPNFPSLLCVLGGNIQPTVCVAVSPRTILSASHFSAGGGLTFVMIPLTSFFQKKV